MARRPQRNPRGRGKNTHYAPTLSRAGSARFACDVTVADLMLRAAVNGIRWWEDLLTQPEDLLRRLHRESVFPTCVGMNQEVGEAVSRVFRGWSYPRPQAGEPVTPESGVRRQGEGELSEGMEALVRDSHVLRRSGDVASS